MPATWRAARTTFGLLGRTMTSRASTPRMASSSSPVLGFVDCPPGTTAATPNSWKIAASPSPATTATTPSAGAPRCGVAAAERARASRLGRRCFGRGEGGGPRLADVARLVVEVLDADPAERARAPGRRPTTGSGRSLWTWTLSARLSPATRTDSPIDSRCSRMASTSRLPDAVGLEQEHRLVAEALVGVRDEGRRLDRGAATGVPARGARRRPPDEVQQGALEQPVEALPARVDDAGLAQDGQQARRPGDGLLGGVERRGQDRLDVVVPFGGDDRGVGGLADDRRGSSPRPAWRPRRRPSSSPATGRGRGRGR